MRDGKKISVVLYHGNLYVVTCIVKNTVCKNLVQNYVEGAMNDRKAYRVGAGTW